MTSHGQVAMRERRRKETHPESFCPERSCLWRATSGPCPRHSPAKSRQEQQPKNGDRVRDQRDQREGEVVGVGDMGINVRMEDGVFRHHGDLQHLTILNDEAAPTAIDLMQRLEASLAKSARAQTQVVAETLQADGDLGEESAAEYVASALTILAQPDADIDELDLAAVRDRLNRALAQLQHEGRAF